MKAKDEFNKVMKFIDNNMLKEALKWLELIILLILV